MMTLRYLGIGGGSPDALLHIVLQVNAVIYFGSTLQFIIISPFHINTINTML